MMRPLKLLAIAGAAVLLAGCAGYHLGPTNGAIAGDKSIEVLPFNNQTLQARLGDAVTQSLREQMQTDGTYHLATDGKADLVLTGVITAYNREAVSFLNTDVATPDNYRVGITAHVTVRDTATGRILLNENVKGMTLVHVGADLASDEREALPLLAEDLSRNIAERLTEGTW